MGDDYSASEIEIFASDVQRNAENLFTDPTLAHYRDKINIYRIDSTKDLKCKSGEDCYNSVTGIISGGSEVRACCDINSVMETSSVCPNRNIVLTLVNTQKSIGTAQFWQGLGKLDVSIEWVTSNVLHKNRKGIAICNRGDLDCMIHEFGHVVGFLPDYYVNYDQKDIEEGNFCENHPCRMCGPHNDFSSEKLCYDKQKVVKYLNQWCDADVKISRKNPASPYPNPVDLSGFSKVNVVFNVEYNKDPENPCYALMEVYDSREALVDYVVSDEPVGNGQHTLQWDGKDLEQRQIASGVYIYKVSIGIGKRNKDSVRGTVLK